MTDTSSAAPRPHFDSGKAFTFIFEVYRARPGAFIGLSVIHVLLFSIASLIMLWITAEPTAAFMTASAGGVEPTPEQLGAFFGAMALGYVPFIAIWFIVEAGWLRLTTRGEGGLLPNPADVLRVFLGFLILWILSVLVLVLLTALVAVAGWAAGQVSAVFGYLAGALLGLVALFFFLAWCVRISPVVALSVLERGLRIGGGIGGSRTIFWPLFGAWFLVVLVFLALSLVGWVVALMMPGPMGAMMAASMDAANPAAYGEAMSAMFANTGTLLVAFVSYVILMIISLPGYLLARGVASKAALYISALRTDQAAPAAPPPPAPATEQTPPRAGDEPLA
ncbi:hypothetical protein FKB34_09585 [Glycocaulis profundi]|nr:hypothetical protein FKB34_09585 [Glycocaulis profundi]